MAETESSSFESSEAAPQAWWRDLRTAGAFLTRLPLPWGVTDGRLARAYRAFPLVGAAAGAGVAAVYAAAAGLGLPPPVAAVLAVGAALLLTGGLHEDGLADVADGFGGGATRDDKLRIMRDSRVGTYGILALLVTLGLRAACLAALAAPAAVAAALVAAGAVSRAAMPGAMLRLVPARADGLAAGGGRPDAAVAATGLALGAALALLVLGPAAGLAALAAAGLATGLLVLLAARQVGGYTGDVLGAIQQAAEVAVLLAAVAVAA